MTKNLSTPLQGIKSTWLPSVKVKELIDHVLTHLRYA